MRLVDVHCHLDAPAYQDVDTICQQSRHAGVNRIVAAGMGLASNRRILNLQQRYPGQIWAALGLHPERTDTSWEELEAVVAQVQAQRKRVVAFGEIGLPHYAVLEQRLSPLQVQERESFLHTLVQAAARLDLPVVLHAPHAMAAVALDVLKRYQPPGALFHWHKSTPEVTAAVCDAGYFVSITPEVCYRERDQHLARMVPLDNLLVESDGPWPYGGEFAGQLTTPAVVARVVQEVARVKDMPLADVWRATTANAERLFGRTVSTADPDGREG